MKRPVRKYTKECKQEAVNLAFKLPSISQAAEELWIPVGTLHTWIQQLKTNADLIKNGEEKERLKNRPTRPAASLVNRNFCGVSFEECRILAASFLEVSIPSKNLVWG